MSKVWRAYENDGVELSKPEGCKTMEEAIAICKEEWQYGLDEMGYDPEFDFYVELTEETEQEITVLDTVKLHFSKKKSGRRGQ